MFEARFVITLSRHTHKYKKLNFSRFRIHRSILYWIRWLCFTFFFPLISFALESSLLISPFLHQIQLVESEKTWEGRSGRKMKSINPSMDGATWGIQLNVGRHFVNYRNIEKIRLIRHQMNHVTWEITSNATFIIWQQREKKEICREDKVVGGGGSSTKIREIHIRSTNEINSFRPLKLPFDTEYRVFSAMHEKSSV